MKRELMGDLNRFTDLNKHKNSNIKLLLIIARYLITSANFRVIFFYRLANQRFFKDKKIRIVFSKLGSILSGIYIAPTVKIGSGLLLGNPKCIVIHHKCSFGKNVTILQNVTLGGNINKKKGNQISPIIGDNVLLGAGAKILGPVYIGNNSMIGANAVVINDVPKNSVAVGIPAKVVKKVDKSYFELSKDDLN
jgi:serine O-acetyltransferase